MNAVLLEVLAIAARDLVRHVEAGQQQGQDAIRFARMIGQPFFQL